DHLAAQLRELGTLAEIGRPAAPVVRELDQLAERGRQCRARLGLSEALVLDMHPVDDLVQKPALRVQAGKFRLYLVQHGVVLHAEKIALGGIFISYRSGSHAVSVGALADSLRHYFGPDLVFADTQLEPGTPYPDALCERLLDSDVLLAVIHEGWLESFDEP